MSRRTYSPYTVDAIQIFSKLIRLKRKERRITQKGLAERAGVSRAMIQRIEAADLKSEIGVVFEIAVLLGIKLFDEPNSQADLKDRLQDKIAVLPASVLTTQTTVSNDF